MCDQKNGGDRGDDVDELSASDESEPEEQPSSAPFDPELDDDDDDDDDDGGVEISAPSAGHRGQSAFSLRGGGSAFSNRSHSIFDCLDSVARLASSSLKPESVSDGVFVRPFPPRPSRKTSQPPPSCPTPAKKSGTPDYLVHPERWTHYSLEDVTETSNQGNSRAAHNFLSSLQQRKGEQESPADSSCNTQQKVVFSRPGGLPKEQPAEPLSAVRGKDKEKHLSHLEEENEEEEGEKEKAGGRRTDQSVEKAEERARDEEKDSGAVVQKEKGEVEEEEEEEEEKIDEANPSFTSFRKTKRKNYRKSSGREDN